MRVFVKRPGENFVEQHAIGNPRWIATLIIGEPVDYYVNDDYGMIVYRQMDQTGSPDNVCWRRTTLIGRRLMIFGAINEWM